MSVTLLALSSVRLIIAFRIGDVIQRRAIRIFPVLQHARVLRVNYRNKKKEQIETGSS